MTGKTINILDFGVKNNGKEPVDAAVQSAISSLNGGFGIIHFPTGKYLFKEPIFLVDSIIIQGDGADNTFFTFDLDGSNDLIHIEGSALSVTHLLEKAEIGSKEIIISDLTGIRSGDLIRIFQDDADLVTSDWAITGTGQLAYVAQVSTKSITLTDELRMTYDPARSAKIQKINPVTNVAINCINIRPMDVSIDQTSNIKFKYAANCLVQGIESDQCNFAHINLSQSAHIKVSGSYFHHGFDYGGGGKAYGVVAQQSTGNCLIENNIFEHLRHSILVQAGANGNVFAYNYSIDPFWEETFSPSNAAGDIVLHGNYPYANLFEGNIIQNIVIDNSHDENGPFNTFFRNRAELFGFVMLPSPPSDLQNIVGNDISNLNEDNGLFITFGEGHFSYGNLVKGEIIPLNTTVLSDTSYYLANKPLFLGNFPWPAVGLPNASDFFSIPARHRYSKKEYTICGNEMPVIIRIPRARDTGYLIYPNPNTGEFIWTKNNVEAYPISLQVRDIRGNLIYRALLNTNKHLINLTNANPGIYFVITETPAGSLTYSRMIIW